MAFFGSRGGNKGCLVAVRESLDIGLKILFLALVVMLCELDVSGKWKCE